MAKLRSLEDYRKPIKLNLHDMRGCDVDNDFPYPFYILYIF